jgi:protein ImuA
MRAAAFMAEETFAHLRRQIAQIEANVARGKDGERNAPPPVPGMAEADFAQTSLTRPSQTLAPQRGGETLPFGLAKLDALLAGGLHRAALHEMRIAESRDAAAMTGFAVALLSRLADEDTRPLLWIVEQAVGAETGLPYGGGLRTFGLDPADLIVVRVRRPIDALWAFEEGLRCAGLAAVVAEMQGNPRALDLTASRRLALRAAESGVTGFLLRQSARATPSASTTRWLVGPLRASADEDFPEGIGNPAWRLTLERNRHGATGVFDMEWNHEQRRFAPALATAHPRPLAAVPVDRSPPPPEPRKIVAAGAGSTILPREEKRRRLQSRG